MDRRWQVFAVTSIAVFMVALDVFVVNVAFGAIAEDFDGADLADISWVLNAYAIVFAALLIPAGRLADRIGRRRTFFGGLTLFLAASALCGAAWSVESLVAARVLQAAGAAILTPTANALMLREFPEHQRTVAASSWAAVGAIAAALGPPLGGLALEVSWRFIFFANLPFGFLALAFSFPLLRESRDEGQTLPDLAGALIVIVATALLALGLVKAPEWGWLDARTLGALGGSAGGLAWFLSRCRTHPSPIVDLRMFRARAFSMAQLASVMFSCAFAAMLLCNLLFLMEVWRYTPLEAGLGIAPAAALAAPMSMGMGRLAHRIQLAHMAAVGNASMAVAALWWLWRLRPDPDYLVDQLPGLMFFSLGMSLAVIGAHGAWVTALEPERFATGAAVYNMLRQQAFVLGISLFVAVVGTGAVDASALDNGFVLGLVIAVATVPVALGIGRVTVTKHAKEPEPVLAPVAAVAREPTR